MTEGVQAALAGSSPGWDPDRAGWDPRARAEAVAPGWALLASPTAMAEILPLRALHYDLAMVGPLADLAPPYDVIDVASGPLLARSP